MSHIGYRTDCGRTGDRIVADFEIKGFGEGYLLLPASRASRAWCQSNLSDDVPMSGDGYVVEEQLMLLIIDRFMERKPGWFRF